MFHDVKFLLHTYNEKNRNKAITFLPSTTAFILLYGWQSRKFSNNSDKISFVLLPDAVNIQKAHDIPVIWLQTLYIE
jgi:hypothetical protein